MPFLQTAKTLADLIPLLTIIALIFSALIVAMTVGFWTLNKEQITAWARKELGITKLQESVDELSGANRVSYQPPGQTFVIEPVYTDSRIIRVVITSRRTPLGLGWTFVGGTPIFTSVNGVRTTGSLLGPREQLNENIQRRVAEIVPPKNLPAGRTILNIQLHYKNSEGTDHFEMLQYPVIFNVLSAKERPEEEE